ncbi:MAG: MarR family transcriptional regulator [Methanobacterium sp.]|uniref:MarR family winged helix-turn-helix transcriptional regulator n=1 Tax=Methanobacterium sp. TaxID=2164 RepID=UPI003D6621C5|nr:MarR family transcriptional regulator [Methanobacterium sp.]
MKDEEFEKLVDNLLIYYPLFYRKIKTSMSPEKSLKYGKTDGYYQILGMLMISGPLPISQIGRKLYISKPNMTPLIDKLVNDKMVNRLRSKKDRRIINIEITEHGKEFMFEARKMVEENIKNNLSNLTNMDLEILNESLRNIKKLSLKINPQ